MLIRIKTGALTFFMEKEVGYVAIQGKDYVWIILH